MSLFKEARKRIRTSSSYIRREVLKIPEAIAIHQAAEFAQSFALSKNQIPKKTLFAEGGTSIDLKKESEGSIFRIRINNSSKNPPSLYGNEYKPLFFVSTKVDDSWFFVKFSSTSKQGNPNEFHVDMNNLENIEYSILPFQTTDFEIQETHINALPFLGESQLTVLGIDIMMIGSKSSGIRTRDPNYHFQPISGFARQKT